eukprot:6713091-Pyramimonas_sp.AAC.1
MPQYRHSMAIMTATIRPTAASERSKSIFFRSVRSKDLETEISHSLARIPYRPAARPTPPAPPNRSA